MDIEQLIEFTQAIVQLPSFSGEEAAVAQRVADEMRSLAFDQVYTDENGSVIGIIEGTQPGKTILLDAHTDTVGISPGVPWEYEPFGAVIEDDAIYGRGAADMKGALAAMIHAAASLDRSQLRGRVFVTATPLEEVLEGVALQPIVERYQPDFVIIGEPSDLNLVHAGRGRAEVHLTTVGCPAHSSSPQLGRNAVLDMMNVIAAVEALPMPTHPLMGPALYALTDIISDPYPGHSVIPSICKATYDRRLLPGEQAETLLAEITSHPAIEGIDVRAEIGVGTYTAYTGTQFVTEKFFPAWQLPADDWLVQRALSGLHSCGLPSQLSAYRFCTNAAYTAGKANIPTIGFGPAKESDAHVINERLRLADLQAAARGYATIIQAVLQ
jgi:putative selenium metabolism hydrolase